MMIKNNNLGFSLMNYWKFVKDEILRIAYLTIPEKALEEIKKLNEFVNGPKIRYIPSGNYIYCYVEEIFYDPSVKEGRRKRKENLGKIPIETFESNKKKIKQMSKEELKKYLKQY